MAENNAIMKRFGRVSSHIDKVNGRRKNKRFHVMTHSRNNKITDIGVYDSETKKYVLTDVRAYNALEYIDEMEVMINMRSV